jgi:ribonuclease P protein component
VHLLDALPADASPPDGPGAPVTAARAGIVVGKRVGPAVRRNLVKRRLRDQLRSRLPHLPSGSLVVVRALPGAADADFGRLGRSLDSALRSLDALTAERPAFSDVEAER